MLKKTSWNPYSSSGSTRAIKRPLKGKKGRSALKQLRALSPPLGAPKEVLRKCQFLIKTRGHDDHFLREYIQLGEFREAWRWVLAYSGPPELGVPSPQIKRSVDNWSVDMPKSEFWMWVLVLWARLGRSQAPITNTAASRHRGLALTINAMNKSHKRVGMLYTGWDNPLFYPSRILFMLE